MSGRCPFKSNVLNEVRTFFEGEEGKITPTMGGPARVGRSGLRNCSLNFPHNWVLTVDQPAGRSGQIVETLGIPAFRIRQDQIFPLNRVVHKPGCA